MKIPFAARSIGFPKAIFKLNFTLQNLYGAAKFTFYENVDVHGMAWHGKMQYTSQTFCMMAKTSMQTEILLSCVTFSLFETFRLTVAIDFIVFIQSDRSKAFTIKRVMGKNDKILNHHEIDEVHSILLKRKMAL